METYIFVCQISHSNESILFGTLNVKFDSIDERSHCTRSPWICHKKDIRLCGNRWQRLKGRPNSKWKRNYSNVKPIYTSCCSRCAFRIILSTNGKRYAYSSSICEVQSIWMQAASSAARCATNKCPHATMTTTIHTIHSQFNPICQHWEAYGSRWRCA